MEEHLKYSASKMSRILACPGSVALYERLGIKDDHGSTSVSRRGTRLHEITAEILKGPHGFDPLDAVKPYGLNINDAGAVIECLEFYKSLVTQLGDNALSIHIECQYTLRDFPDCGGTADIVIVDHTDQKVYVVDWKFGEGIKVYVDKNIQLLTYGVAVQDTLGLRHYSLSLAIVQPAFGTFDFWLPTPEEIADYYTIVEQVLSDISDERVPGKEQCFWCDAAPRCPEYVSFVNQVAAEVFKVDIDVTPMEDLVELSNKFSQVKTAMKRIDDYLASALRRGDSVPGKKLVRGRMSRKWLDEAKAIEYLSQHLDDDLLFESKLITPPKAEKLGLKKDPEFHKLYEKVPGKAIMANEDDKREAINSPKEVFSAYI